MLIAWRGGHSHPERLLLETSSALINANRTATISTSNLLTANHSFQRPDTMALFDAERYQRVHLPADLLQSNHAVFGKCGLLGADGCLERFDIWYHPPRRRQPAPGGKQSQSANGAHVDEVVVFDVQVGRKLIGHEGLVHGGIISLLFDEAIGWGYQCFAHESQYRGRGGGSRKRRHAHELPERDQTIQWEDLDATPPAVTANLIVKFKQPLPAGQRCLLRVYHVQSEGRKRKHHFHACLSLEMCNRSKYDNSISESCREIVGTKEKIINANALAYAEATCLMVEVNETQLSRL